MAPSTGYAKSRCSFAGVPSSRSPSGRASPARAPSVSCAAAAAGERSTQARTAALMGGLMPGSGDRGSLPAGAGGLAALDDLGGALHQGGCLPVESVRLVRRGLVAVARAPDQRGGPQQMLVAEEQVPTEPRALPREDGAAL